MCTVHYSHGRERCFGSNSNTNWKNAKCVFDGHFLDLRKDKTKGARGFKTYSLCMERKQRFLATVENQEKNVIAKLDDALSERVKKN